MISVRVGGSLAPTDTPPVSTLAGGTSITVALCGSYHNSGEKTAVPLRTLRQPNGPGDAIARLNRRAAASFRRRTLRKAAGFEGGGSRDVCTEVTAKPVRTTLTRASSALSCATSRRRATISALFSGRLSAASGGYNTTRRDPHPRPGCGFACRAMRKKMGRRCASYNTPLASVARMACAMHSRVSNCAAASRHVAMSLNAEGIAWQRKGAVRMCVGRADACRACPVARQTTKPSSVISALVTSVMAAAESTACGLASRKTTICDCDANATEAACGFFALLVAAAAAAAAAAVVASASSFFLSAAVAESALAAAEIEEEGAAAVVGTTAGQTCLTVPSKGVKAAWRRFCMSSLVAAASRGTKRSVRSAGPLMY